MAMHRFIALAAASVLAASTAAQSAPRRGVDAPEQPTDLNEKIICKRFVKIGSLVDSYRTCKTKAEWQRERDNLRQVNISDSCRTRGTGMPSTPIPGSPGTYDC
jgi:hypothetical protein